MGAETPAAAAQVSGQSHRPCQVARGGGGAGAASGGSWRRGIGLATARRGASRTGRFKTGAPGCCAAAGIGKSLRTATLMLSFSGSLKVFVAVEACDMRKGFNGLHGLVTEELGEDPRQGALFVFTNKRHTRIKILCWDGTGLWVLTKRLEQGIFSWPKNLEPQSTKLKLTPQALAMLTDGVDLRGEKLRPWYEREG